MPYSRNREHRQREEEHKRTMQQREKKGRKKAATPERKLGEAVQQRSAHVLLLIWHQYLGATSLALLLLFLTRYHRPVRTKRKSLPGPRAAGAPNTIVFSGNETPAGTCLFCHSPFSESTIVIIIIY